MARLTAELENCLTKPIYLKGKASDLFAIFSGVHSQVVFLFKYFVELGLRPRWVARQRARLRSNRAYETEGLVRRPCAIFSGIHSQVVFPFKYFVESAPPENCLGLVRSPSVLGRRGPGRSDKHINLKGKASDRGPSGIAALLLFQCEAEGRVSGPRPKAVPYFFGCS